MQRDPAKSVSVLRIFFSNKQAWDKISACHLRQLAMIHSVINSQFMGRLQQPSLLLLPISRNIYHPDASVCNVASQEGRAKFFSV